MHACDRLRKNRDKNGLTSILIFCTTPTQETSASKSKVPREKDARRLDTGLAAVAAAMHEVQEVGQEKSAAAAVGSKTNKSSINSSQYNFTMPKDMRGR